MQEYDNEAEQAISDVALHYTDTPLDIGKFCMVVRVVRNGFFKFGSVLRKTTVSVSVRF